MVLCYAIVLKHQSVHLNEYFLSKRENMWFHFVLITMFHVDWCNADTPLFEVHMMARYLACVLALTPFL